MAEVHSFVRTSFPIFTFIRLDPRKYQSVDQRTGQTQCSLRSSPSFSHHQWRIVWRSSSSRPQKNCRERVMIFFKTLKHRKSLSLLNRSFAKSKTNVTTVRCCSSSPRLHGDVSLLAIIEARTASNERDSLRERHRVNICSSLTVNLDCWFRSPRMRVWPIEHDTNSVSKIWRSNFASSIMIAMSFFNRIINGTIKRKTWRTNSTNKRSPSLNWRKNWTIRRAPRLNWDISRKKPNISFKRINDNWVWRKKNFALKKTRLFDWKRNSVRRRDTNVKRRDSSFLF